MAFLLFVSTDPGPSHVIPFSPPPPPHILRSSSFIAERRDVYLVRTKKKNPPPLDDTSATRVESPVMRPVNRFARRNRGATIAMRMYRVYTALSRIIIAPRAESRPRGH